MTGEMVPLQWKAREFTSINRWQPTLNWTKLNTEVEEVANLIISKAIKSSMMCRFNLRAAALAKVACDCGGAPRDDCFTLGAIQDVPIGEQRFFSGIGGVAEWSTVSIKVDPDSISQEQDDVLIEATSSGSVQVLLATTDNRISARRRLHNKQRSPADPNEFEVVTNLVNYIVGQLVSDGVTLIIPPNVTINVCITIDQDIPRDPESLYPVRDFATYNATGPKWTPLNLTIVMVGDHVQFCTDISESGTYFAILRMEPWEFVTGAPTLSPTTGTPTASPTSTPTAAPNATATPTFAPVESSLPSAALISIILGSLAGVALIVVLVAVCTRPSMGEESYEPLESQIMPVSYEVKAQSKGKTRHGLKKFE